jgi:hypothetical protein
LGKAVAANARLTEEGPATGPKPGGQHAADVDEDVAAELRVAGAQRLEGLPAQPLELAVGERAQRSGSRPPIEERAFADRGRSLDRHRRRAGRLQLEAPVGE